MLFENLYRSSRQCGLPELVLPFLACVFHFITSNRSFRAVCIRDLTVPAGMPSIAPTSVASISSTSESCKTLRSLSGKRSISFRSLSNMICCSAPFAPSTIARVSVICHAVSRVSRRRWPLCRFNARRKTIRFTHPRNCPKCCRQSENLAADSQRCARQIPPRDCAFQLSQSAHSCTPQSRLCCPFLVWTPPSGPSFRKIARLVAVRSEQIEVDGILRRAAGDRAAHSPAVFHSNQKRKIG